MDYILAGLALLVGFFAYLLHGATNNRLKKAQQELDDISRAVDVRRKAEAAKHNDPDAIKRLRDKYNS